MIAEALLIERQAFQNRFKREPLLGPSDAAQQPVERGGRTIAVQLVTMEPPGEIKQVSIDLPPRPVSSFPETTNDPSGSKIIRGNCSSAAAASSHVTANEEALGFAKTLTWKRYRNSSHQRSIGRQMMPQLVALGGQIAALCSLIGGRIGTWSTTSRSKPP